MELVWILGLLAAAVAICYVSFGRQMTEMIDDMIGRFAYAGVGPEEEEDDDDDEDGEIRSLVLMESIAHPYWFGY